MSQIPQGNAGSYSVAVIGRPLGEGSLAHRYTSLQRSYVPPRMYGNTEIKRTVFIAACAADEDDADEAYLSTAAWADHHGAGGCTEPQCFPDA